MNQPEIAQNWSDYELIQTGDGKKLERWGTVHLLRPDPQVIWPLMQKWKQYDAEYLRDNTGGGKWLFNKKLPKNWSLSYKNLKFKVQPTNFKHTGLFPEQAFNWDWITNKCISFKNLKVLNLFAYTGAASVVAASAGASVTHVDSAKGMVEWAKSNLQLSDLSDKPVRFLIDDCMKFVEREIRRGNKYDAIIMDPPSYGRGKQGEIWKLEKNIFDLLKSCSKLISENFHFFLLNSYTTGLSSTVLTNLVRSAFNFQDGSYEYGELGLNEQLTQNVLPCGTFCRWSKI